MEFCFYISKTDLLSKFDESCNRIYFGAEFCERLIPEVQDIEKVKEFTLLRGLEFSLMTPYCTDNGIEKLKKLFTFIAANFDRAEVIVNDWGVLNVLKENFPTLTPVLGRLMTKMKRDPRLIPLLPVINQGSRDYYSSTNLNLPWYRKFLHLQGIRRVELDNPYQKIISENLPKDLSISLYMPFAYISTTRFCLAAGCEKEENEFKAGITPCSKECDNYTFLLQSPGMPVPLIRRGNTIFMKKDSVPDNLSECSIDRIVLQPEIPF